MKYIDPLVRQDIKQTIDTFPKGVYCHKRVIGEKVIPMHVHTDKSQLMYVDGKCIRIFFKENDEVKTLFLPSRHFAWMPAGVLHSVQATSPDFMMRNIYFTEVGEDDFYKKVGIYAVSDLLLEMLNYIESWNGLILPEDEKRYVFLKAIQAILPDAAHKKLPFALPIAHDERLQEVLSFIEEQLMNELRLDMICKKFGFSSRTFLRLFQSDLKMSYAQYVKTLRTIRAIELLTTTPLSINEVAIHVGYDSYPTFSNTFFDIVGVRPKVYKR